MCIGGQFNCMLIVSFNSLRKRLTLRTLAYNMAESIMKLMTQAFALKRCKRKF